MIFVPCYRCCRKCGQPVPPERTEIDEQICVSCQPEED